MTLRTNQPTVDQQYIDKRVKEELEGIEANPPVESWLVISEGLDRRLRKPWYLAMLPVAVSLVAVAAAVVSLLLLMPDDQAFEAPPVTETTSGMSPQRIVSLPPAALDAATFSAQLSGKYIPDDHVPGRPASSRQPPTVLIAQSAEGIAVPLRGMSLVFGAHADDQHPPPSFAAVHEKAPRRPDRIVSAFHGPAINGLRGVRFGAHFASQTNYRLLRDGGEHFGVQNIPFEALEDRLLTYGMGLTATYALSERWSVQTGLSYLNTGQYVRDILAYAHPTHKPLYHANSRSGRSSHPQTIITSQGQIHLYDPHYYFADTQSQRVRTNEHTLANTEIQILKRSAEGITQVFSYVELPLLIRYHVVNGAIGLNVKAGIAGNYLLENEVFLGNNLMSNSIGATYGVKNFNFSAIGGFALDVPLTSRVHFHLEPTAQIFLSPVVRPGIITDKAFPYSYSLRTGLSYGL